MRLSPVLVSIAAFAGIVGTSTPARADLVNDGRLSLTCELTAERPYPVILVHGQSGNVAGMTGVIDRLNAERFCVYGMDYGMVPGGANGQAHLWDSAAQISGFIDHVMAVTKAPMVNVIGHSAGTGVLDNYILQKGGAPKVHSFISFGGLHHPYWHLGAATFVDLTIHLPNLIEFGRLFFPGLTINMVIDILSVFIGDPMMKATVTSPFVKDLFDENYWNTIHGGPSEPSGVFAKMIPGRTLPTRDSIPGICNTNIIGLGDMLVNDATGWQDVASHVDNFITTTAVTANTHNDVLGNVDALNKMVEGLTRDCGNQGIAPRSVPALNPLDNEPVAGSSSEAEALAKQKKRQAEFAEVFLKELNQKYGDQLERSGKALPWEDGYSEGGDDDEAVATPSGAACSASPAQSGQGTAAMAFGALALAVGIRARRRKSE